MYKYLALLRITEEMKLERKVNIEGEHTIFCAAIYNIKYKLYMIINIMIYMYNVKLTPHSQPMVMT